MGQWDDKFERHEQRWQSWTMQAYPQDDRVLSHIIRDKARQRPNLVAFQFRQSEITLSRLSENMDRAANGLLSLGVRHGDKVAIMLPNCPEFLYVWFALNSLGAVAVPINTALKGDGLAYQMVQSDCVALVADLPFIKRLSAVTDKLSAIRHLVLTDTQNSGNNLPNWPGFESLWFSELLGHAATTPASKVRHDDLASIMYTSGTTGVSKGVMFSHHYWYAVWAEAVRYCRYTDEDILYTGLPFFHGNAQGMTVGPALLADAKAVIVERFSASQLMDDCRRWHCTEANYIGGIIPILLKQEPREDDADNPLRLMVGAAAPAESWHQFQTRFNTKILEVYGMTECYCCLANPYDEPRAGACGKRITGWDVRIVDDNDNECRPGTLGEFVARSTRPFVGTTGYYRKPEDTDALFKNGWIHTGDLGRMDEDGYFYFVDRKKQAIRRRGENISSFEVESVINAHDSVLECCVVGVPSDVGEEDVKAVIVLKANKSLPPEELIKWCEPRLAYFAVPRFIAIRDQLPKTPSERVEKFKLKREGVTSDCWDRDQSGITLEK